MQANELLDRRDRVRFGFERFVFGDELVDLRLGVAREQLAHARLAEPIELRRRLLREPRLVREEFARDLVPVVRHEGRAFAEHRLDTLARSVLIASLHAGLRPRSSGSGRSASMCASGRSSEDAELSEVLASFWYSASSRFIAFAARASNAANLQRVK